MKAPVVDCSATAAWVLADEDSEPADAALEVVVEHGALAPALWWAEIRNVLLKSERLGRINPEDTESALASLAELRIRLDHTPRGSEVLRLARAYGLTAYDAVYLELALREGRSLATLDRKLAGAAEAEGVNPCTTNGGSGDAVQSRNH